MEMDEDYLRSTSNINDGFNQLLKADTKRDLTSLKEKEHEKGRIPEKWNIKRPIYHSTSCLSMTAATRLLPIRLSLLIDTFECSHLL